jgi:hypothetical protein
MKRAQIQLEEETFEALRQRAFREKKSISGVIRELIHKEITLPDHKNPLSMKDFRFIASGKSPQRSPQPISERHDLPKKTACLKDLSRLLRELPRLGAEAATLKKNV